MSTFYMSFADPERPEGEQFLGALVLEADTFEEALTRSHLEGLNPGGEVAWVEIPAEAGKINPAYVGRLLTAEEARALSEPVWGSDA